MLSHVTYLSAVSGGDYMAVARTVVNVVKSSSSLSTLNAKLPLLNLSLNDAISFTNGLLDGIDEIISKVDPIELKKATDVMETAVNNLSMSVDDRQLLFRAIDLLRRVPADKSDADTPEQAFEYLRDGLTRNHLEPEAARAEAETEVPEIAHTRR